MSTHESLEQYCLRLGETDLLREWDSARNGGTTPRDISYGSKRKVWWRCGKGHVWQAQVTSRTNNHTGCPYCSGTRPCPGETDLATCRPDLAAQWHPSKNGGLRPDQVLPGSHKAVWWRCDKGHEWRAEVKSRTAGCGCPVCANREEVPGENDLASAFPEIAAQWHPVKNGTLSPRDVVAGSHRKVWWRCAKGHEWQAQIAARTRSASGCPVCAGRAVSAGENDLATLAPGIAAQWDPEKNGSLRPTDVAPFSNRAVWWRCEKGHSWKASVASRTSRLRGCPYCAGRRVLAGFNDLATVCPQIAAQWDQSLNGALTPQMVTAGSSKAAWWRCPEGHVWKAVIYSRTGKQRSGCPVCAGKVRHGARKYPPEPQPRQRAAAALPETKPV